MPPKHPTADTTRDTARTHETFSTDTPAVDASEAVTSAEPAAASGGGRSGTQAQLQPGDEFGPRYTVVKLLGIGGMGVVYQAWDKELNEAVALKVIKPYAKSRPADLERLFKQELVLARKITHRNVIRIHDLGDVGGTKYISMPFVDGTDLAKLLRERGCFPVKEALHIAKQIAAGLGAAHEVGVVHRDLKPANILMGSDAALLTDFGIAYSLAGPAEAGVVGTLRYMAPEQARGLPVDHRADVYAFGLILFEMLKGARWNADLTTAQLLRVDESKQVEDFRQRKDLPAGVNRVLSRCLAVDPAKRYASAAMLLDDLSTLDDAGHIVARPRFLHVPSSWPLIGGRMIARGTATAILALLVFVPIVGVAAYITSARITESNLVPHAPVSILMADIDNRTGDAVFDGTVEPALALALEGASFVDLYPREEARRLSEQIAKSRQLNLERARLVAQREGINVVLAGSITADGSRFRLSLDAVDSLLGTVLTSTTQVASGKDDVLRAVGELGSDVRSALGDTTPESVQLAERETFTTGSIEAASQYSQGQDLLQRSRYADSIPFFRRATELDPAFGRAFVSLGLSEFYEGDRQQAEDHFKQAFTLMDRMTEREKYRTRGVYYLTVARAYQEAIANYTKLVELYPADRAANGNLAVAYFYTLNFAKAAEYGRRALDVYPASPKLRSNYALYAMYSGNFDTAAQEAEKAITADPSYVLPYVPLAIAAIAKAPETAESVYERMAKSGPRGVSRALAGRADLALYQGRYDDAERLLMAAPSTDNREALAINQVLLTEAYAARGMTSRTVAAAREALALSRGETVSFPVARALASVGRDAQARELAFELSSRTEGYSRVYAQMLQAELAIRARRPVDAVEYLRAAQKTVDLWLVHYLLGVAYVNAGRFQEALAELDVCATRRGEATAVFLDDVPTFRYLAPLPYWTGRAQEGMGLAPRAVESYQQFLSLRPDGTDALTVDVRNRLSKLKS